MRTRTKSIDTRPKVPQPENRRYEHAPTDVHMSTDQSSVPKPNNPMPMRTRSKSIDSRPKAPQSENCQYNHTPIDKHTSIKPKISKIKVSNKNSQSNQGELNMVKSLRIVLRRDKYFNWNVYFSQPPAPNATLSKSLKSIPAHSKQADPQPVIKSLKVMLIRDERITAAHGFVDIEAPSSNIPISKPNEPKTKNAKRKHAQPLATIEPNNRDDTLSLKVLQSKKPKNVGPKR